MFRIKVCDKEAEDSLPPPPFTLQNLSAHTYTHTPQPDVIPHRRSQYVPDQTTDNTILSLRYRIPWPLISVVPESRQAEEMTSYLQHCRSR